MHFALLIFSKSCHCAVQVAVYVYFTIYYIKTTGYISFERKRAQKCMFLIVQIINCSFLPLAVGFQNWAELNLICNRLQAIDESR